jgi:hypothetical protein
MELVKINRNTVNLYYNYFRIIRDFLTFVDHRIRNLQKGKKITKCLIMAGLLLNSVLDSIVLIKSKI